MRVILFSIALLLLWTHASYAQVDYYAAYRICSPAADQLTKQSCNYAIVYEKYYKQCMYKYGYGDDADVSGDFYQGYMQAYSYCASSSEYSAKSYCNYGTVFKAHYDRCMARYRFNPQGEKMTDPPSDDDAFKFNF